MNTLGLSTTNSSEDTWGVAEGQNIFDTTLGQNDATDLYNASLDNFEISMMFAGFNDDRILSPNVANQYVTQSVGGSIQVWADPKLGEAGHVSSFSMLGGPADRTGPMGYNTATDGVLLLDLIPVALNADGHTLQSTLDIYSLIGTGVVYLNVNPLVGEWATVFDTNAWTTPAGLNADLQLSLNSSGIATAPAGWTVVGNAIGFAEPQGQVIPEPTTVALLGIGLVGMAGVAARRKLKKKAVEK
jgi:hypothetical protein